MSTATAAAADFKCDILGKPFILAEWTGREYAEFDMWIAGRIIARCRAAIAGLEPGQDRQDFVDSAVRLASMVETRLPMKGSAADVVASIAWSQDGQIEQCRLMLRRNQLPTETIARLFQNDEWITAYYAARRDYLNPPPKDQPAPPPAQPSPPTTSIAGS